MEIRPVGFLLEAVNFAIAGNIFQVRKVFYSEDMI